MGRITKLYETVKLRIQATLSRSRAGVPFATEALKPPLKI